MKKKFRPKLVDGIRGDSWTCRHVAQVLGDWSGLWGNDLVEVAKPTWGFLRVFQAESE